MAATGAGGCCTCTPVVETEYGGDTGATPSEAVIEALAAVEGVDPVELGPLYETIDGDALDRLFEHGANRGAGTIVLRFSVDGWNVFVRDDGVVRVCDPDRVTGLAPVFGKAIED